MRKSSLTPTIANGRLTLVLASGVRLDFALPNVKDLAAIAALRTEIQAFGRKNDLTRGQINAAFKELTKNGYYTAGPQSARKRAHWLVGQLSEEQKRKLLDDLK
jgi:hypothetical protein